MNVDEEIDYEDGKTIALLWDSIVYHPSDENLVLQHIAGPFPPLTAEE
jgi:hypothetical protein